jgi:CRP-like cAMP-binding protein
VPAGTRLVEETIKEKLCEKSVLYQYMPSDVAYYQEGDEQGRRNTALHIVISGVFHIEGTRDGRRIHSRISTRGDLFGELEALKQNDEEQFWGCPNLATARAQTEALVLQIEYEAFLECELESSLLLTNMQEWLARRSYANLLNPWLEPNTSAREDLYLYVRALIDMYGFDANTRKIKSEVSLTHLRSLLGDISRQRLHDLLNEAQEKGNFVVHSREHRVEVLKEPEHWSI